MPAPGMTAALLLAATAAREPAWKRHQDLVQAVRWKLEDPSRSIHDKDLDHLTLKQLHARLEPVARELGADLVDPGVPWGDKRVTLDLLAKLHDAARPAIPQMVEALDLYPADHGPQGVGHFCEVTRTLEKIAPTDERSLRAVGDWLRQNAKGNCHRCGCGLDLIKKAGPAARDIAGPVLEELAHRPGLTTTYPSQLADTLAAVGMAGGMSATLLDRVADESRAYGDRVASLKALAGDVPRLDDRTRAELTTLASRLLGHDYMPLRQAAAETLGGLGAPALASLRAALQDAHYKVRAAAATSLGQLGAAAAPAAADLAEALDPFRGTASAAAGALVAIGLPAVPLLQARSRAAPSWLEPLVGATIAAVREGNPAPAHAALRRYFQAGPGGIGFVRIEVRRTGRGPSYDPRAHRAKIHAEGGAVGPGSAGLPHFDHTIDAYPAPNAVFMALAGQREGARLHVTLSPEAAQSPLAGTEIWVREQRLQRAVPDGVAATYDVDIARVCKPVIWQPLPAGIFADVKFEVFCKRPD